MTSRYLTQVLFLFITGGLLAAQPLASAGNFTPLNWLGPLLDESPHDSTLYLMIGSALQLVLAAIVYALWLRPTAARRDLRVVWLNGAAAMLPTAGWLMALDVVARVFPLDLYTAGGVATVLVPPTLLLLAEAALARLLRHWGLSARARGWRFSALRLLKASLRLRPAHPAAAKAAGLLLLESDDFKPGLELLALLGPIERLEDDQVLRAMEQAYRTQGDIAHALDCLLRLRQLRYNTPGLDRRILDDFVKLQRWGEAIELLESGRLKVSIDLLLIQQQAHLHLGNYAQAMALTQKIAEQEGPPHARATRLYQQLLATLPGNLEIRIQLGLLLLDDESEPRRREGAALLEDALAGDPTRLHLSRRLARYYAEHQMHTRERDHWRRLVEAGDLDPDPYLNHARVLVEENRLVEAAQTLVRMTHVLPEDWRGHLRLARVQLQQRRVAEAEAAYARAAELIPAESTADGPTAAASLRHLRQDLDQWHRDQRVSALTEDVRQHESDLDMRLGLLDECIAAGKLDQLLDGCEKLLEARPDASAAVEQKLLAAIDQVEQPFRVMDYLADLLYAQHRDPELLDLYRRMAKASIHPAQTIITGAQRLLDRNPGFLEARLELALAQRLIEDWGGILATLDPVMHLPLVPRDEAGAPAADAAAAPERLALAAPQAPVAPAAAPQVDPPPAIVPPPLDDFFNLAEWAVASSDATESGPADFGAPTDDAGTASAVPDLDALFSTPGIAPSLPADEAAARVIEPRLEAADKALWVEAAFRVGRIDDAIAAANELLEPLADESGFMMMVIDMLNQAGRADAAYDVFKLAKAASPDDPQLTRLERRVFKNRREHRIKQLEEKLAADGLSPAEHYEKAELHRDKGEVQEAIIHYQRAADHEELARIALAKMASSLCERGMYELAEELMEPIKLTRELDAHHPELKELIYELARALEKIKKPQQAARFYKRIFHVDASYRDVVQRLERLS